MSHRIFVGQDYKQDSIWRMKHMNVYKDNRPNKMVFFQMYMMKYFKEH